MPSMTGGYRLGLALILAACAAAVTVQARQLTDEDYQRAEKFLSYNTEPLVDHAVRRVKWLDDGHFWFVDHDAKGDHYKVMDAATGKIAPAFDQQKLAGALNKVAKKPVKADKLDIRDYSIADDGRLDVTVRGEHYLCDLHGKAKCVVKGSKLAHKPGDEPGVVSPNGKYAVFVRDWNLWLRDLSTGKETKLTTDGVKDYGYATGNAGWVHDVGAIVRWSPDSTRVATYRQDQRKVGEMYTITTKVGHPKLERWKYPLPGDKHVFMIEPVIINAKTGKMVKVKMPPEQRLSSLCDTLACGRDHHKWSDVKWAPDSRSLALVSTSRDRQHEWFRVVDAKTGAVRTVFEDSVKTYYESGHGKVNWQYLPKTDQFIWYSEHTNWGNLYLHNLKTGKVEHPITTGFGNVTQVRHIDRKSRTLWFVGVGRVPGINPYYRQFFKVSLDGGKPVPLTPELADHTITMSPDGTYFVDSYSTPSQPPVAVLRASSDGHIIATVAKADISRLKATGWTPPMTFVVTGRDGKTPVYGMLFKPTNFDPHKKYPVIDYIYPGPQTGSVFTFSFMPSRGDHQAMAELGFIVVAIDGMGTPWRSKSFHDTWYGDMGDNTLPDQVTGIKQLAERYPWIDIDRVGIWGHSGGGNATADALFRYPDFFKVGWAESGNHDNRNYENDWGEKYQGLLVTHKDGSTNYDNQANQLIAKNLKGHLMLVHGSIDDNVPHGSTLLVVQALMKANKDFDMLIIPNVHHGYGARTHYITRRRWDYFVHWLAGNQPPHEYKMHVPKDWR
ncbi:MAG TPA: DPP IV N-terminal domain-containing protein [Gammaproteobacteria bacterium]|nr:DPP IV N-terminal domain-containing protein [Gammaproteobacteria bacterium]